MSPIRPREGNLEVREFSRQAVAPAPPPAQEYVPTTLRSTAQSEQHGGHNQPRPPADPPVIGEAEAQAPPAIELVLGELSRLDFAVTDFGEDAPSDAPRPPQAFAPASAVPSASPIPAPPTPAAAAEVFPIPAPQPITVTQPSAQVISEPVAEPLPISLQGVGAGAAKPEQVISAGVSSVIEPRFPHRRHCRCDPR